MAINNWNAHNEMQRRLGEIQSLVQGVEKYFYTSVPKLAEMAVNGLNVGLTPQTPELVVAPFVTFLETVDRVIRTETPEGGGDTIEYTITEDVKAAKESFTVGKGYNFMNDYVPAKYLKEINMVATRAANKLTSAPKMGSGVDVRPTVAVRQMIAAEMHRQIEHMLFNEKNGLFAAGLLWYVEALAALPLGTFTDGTDWAAPFTTLVTDVKKITDAWDQIVIDEKGTPGEGGTPVTVIREARITTGSVETITPYEIEVLERLIPRMAGKADIILAEKAKHDDGDTIPQPVTTYNLDCAGVTTPGTDAGVCVAVVGTGGAYADLTTCQADAVAGCNVRANRKHRHNQPVQETPAQPTKPVEPAKVETPTLANNNFNKVN